MAEQSTELPMIETDKHHSRRNSLGQDALEREEDVLPHYLRASTGSCHDFCKYGRKHAFEEKSRHPFPRRTTKKPSDNQNSVEFQPEKKTWVLQLKPSPNSKTQGPNADEIINWEVPTRSVDGLSPVFSEVLAKKKTSTASLLTKSLDGQTPVLRGVLEKKTSVASLSTKSSGSQSPLLREVLAKKSMQEVLKEPFDRQNPMSREILTQKRRTSVQGRKKKSVDKLRTSVDSNTRLSPKVIKHDVLSSEKPEVALNHASSKAKDKNLSAKHDSSFKTKISPDTSRAFSVRRNSDVKVGQRTGSSKVAVQPASRRASLSPKTPVYEFARGLASPRASLSGKPLVKVASLNAKKYRGSNVALSLKNKKRINEAHAEKPKTKNPVPDQPLNELKEASNDLVQEKTLYVINVEVEDGHLESDSRENLSVEASPPSLSSLKSPSHPQSPSQSPRNEDAEVESEYIQSESEDDPFSEYDESEEMEEAESLGGERKGKHGNDWMIPSVDKDGQPVKLRFRRGRIVEIQSENGGPRRLKFRRGRMLGGNQNLKADAWRSLKSRGNDGEICEAKTDSEKVVLRHQDAHGKKDPQGLFNNVIEETASKLVETRKGKVKALVGAFETVISLQDSQPSANIVS